MTATNARHRATFLLEVALDAARINEQIAGRLRAERERRHLTQEKMAPLVGLSLRQYQRLENGQSMPRWSNIEQIAAALDLDVSALLEAEPGDEAEPVAGASGGTAGFDDARLERMEGQIAEVRTLVLELLGRPGAPTERRSARRRSA